MSEKATQDLYARTLRHGVNLWGQCLPEMQKYDPITLTGSIDHISFAGEDLTQTTFSRPDSHYYSLTASDFFGRIIDRLHRHATTRSMEMQIRQELLLKHDISSRSMILSHSSMRSRIGQLPYQANSFLDEAMQTGEANQQLSLEICESTLLISPDQVKPPISRVEGLTAAEIARISSSFAGFFDTLSGKPNSANNNADVMYRLAGGNVLELKHDKARKERYLSIKKPDDSGGLLEPAKDWHLHITVREDGVRGYGVDDPLAKFSLSVIRPGSKLLETYESKGAYDEVLAFMEDLTGYSDYGMTIPKYPHMLEIGSRLEASMQPVVPFDFPIEDFAKRRSRE